jgi:hypothetical protein
VARGQRDESLRPYSRLPRTELLLFLSSRSSIAFTNERTLWPKSVSELYRPSDRRNPTAVICVHCLLASMERKKERKGKVVSPTYRPHFTPQKHYFFFNASGSHFCQMLSKPQGLVLPKGLGKFKMSLHRVWNPRPSGL